MRLFRRTKKNIIVLSAIITSLVVLMISVLSNQNFFNQKVETIAQKLPKIRITNTKWYSPHRVALWVFSPAMRTPIQIQLLLARDWYARPQAKFPVLFLLDGLRAREDQSGWSLYTNVEQFYLRHNINVVMPIGGQSSFYTDWQHANNGKNYKWETFLVKELPGVLEQYWRSLSVRGVLGISMGGTAAMMLATRYPDFYKFVGSLSGFLQTSQAGMPEVIRYATFEVGHFDAYQMFGPPNNPAWRNHDPYLHAAKLRGKSIYLFAGGGTTGQFDRPSNVPAISNNLTGAGLEILSRLSTQNFAKKLSQLKIPATVVFENTGTHIWPYWQRQAENSWRQTAVALKVAPSEKCMTHPAFKRFIFETPTVGTCITNAYPVFGGLIQDFTNGQLFYRQQTSTVTYLKGAIAGAYLGYGGTKSSLGFPLDSEVDTPNKLGKFMPFEDGMIYWTPKFGAYPVKGAILSDWAKIKYEAGPAGFPISAEKPLPGKLGIYQEFMRGLYYWSKSTGAHFVTGKILEKYAQLGFERSFLKLPITNEVRLSRSGIMTKFLGGNIYWLPGREAFVVANGKIMSAWQTTGFENGRLGYPISDVFSVPGGAQQNFEHGFIKLINNKTEISS